MFYLGCWCVTYWYTTGITITLSLNLHVSEVQDRSNYLKNVYLMGLSHSWKEKKKKNEWMTLSIHGRIERTFYPSLKDFKQKFDFFFSGPMTPQMNQAPHQVITTHSNSSEGKGAPLDWKRNSLTLIALIKPDGLCYHFNFSKSKGETAIMQTHFKLHFNQILYGCFYEFNKNGHLSAAISLWT